MKNNVFLENSKNGFFPVTRRSYSANFKSQSKKLWTVLLQIGVCFFLRAQPGIFSCVFLTFNYVHFTKKLIVACVRAQIKVKYVPENV